jgi:hypothetical protein
MSIEPDGKILLGGDVPITGGFESVLIRYSADGILDPSFGNGGIVLNSFSGSDDEMMALAVQKDGNILAGIGQDLAPAGGSVYRYLAADPVPVALGAKFSTPTKSKLKASKFKSLSGTAEGDGLTRVEVAIGLADAKLLKRSKKCRFVTGANGKTKKYKAVNKKCAPSKWLTATGTTSWSYKFKKKLGPGKYKLYVRAVGTVGAYSPAVSKSLKIVK